jgi:hypothetical protein
MIRLILTRTLHLLDRVRDLRDAEVERDLARAEVRRLEAELAARDAARVVH